MATEAKILANRRNAQKSTGPSSCKGKMVISQNSLKHGLTARQDVIFTESQADFELYRERMLAELDPLGSMESMLAERIVSLSWRLKRVILIQNQTIDAMEAKDKSSPLAKLAQSMLLRYTGQSQGGASDTNGDLALGRLAIKDFSNARVLERLLMYERRTEHSLYKTILELQRLHLIRKFDPLKTTSEL